MFVVLSGPSGAGKTTIVKRLLKDENFTLSVSATTRSPRKGEKDGVDYYFVTEAEFKSMIEDGSLLEWASLFGHYYGTPIDELKRAERTNRILILDVDVQGVEQLRKKRLKGVYIQLRPPSEEELYKRLKKRHTEDETELHERFRQAQYELNRKELFDYFVVNDDIDEAVREIKSIVYRAIEEEADGPCRRGDKA